VSVSPADQAPSLVDFLLYIVTLFVVQVRQYEGLLSLLLAHGPGFLIC
jgi:hypothetical protein